MNHNKIIRQSRDGYIFDEKENKNIIMQRIKEDELEKNR